MHSLLYLRCLICQKMVDQTLGLPTRVIGSQSNLQTWRASQPESGDRCYPGPRGGKSVDPAVTRPAQPAISPRSDHFPARSPSTSLRCTSFTSFNSAGAVDMDNMEVMD